MTAQILRRVASGIVLSRRRDAGPRQTHVDGFVRAFRAFASWLHEQGYTEDNRLARFKHRPAKPPIIEPLFTSAERVD